MVPEPFNAAIKSASEIVEDAQKLKKLEIFEVAVTWSFVVQHPSSGAVVFDSFEVRSSVESKP